MGIFDFLTSDIAIDLGTANTLIIQNGEIVLDEPSIIAMDKLTGTIRAVGREAMQMHEKTHENLKNTYNDLQTQYSSISNSLREKNDEYIQLQTLYHEEIKISYAI